MRRRRKSLYPMNGPGIEQRLNRLPAGLRDLRSEQSNIRSTDKPCLTDARLPCRNSTNRNWYAIVCTGHQSHSGKAHAVRCKVVRVITPPSGHYLSTIVVAHVPCYVDGIGPGRLRDHIAPIGSN